MHSYDIWSLLLRDISIVLFGEYIDMYKWESEGKDYMFFSTIETHGIFPVFLLCPNFALRSVPGNESISVVEVEVFSFDKVSLYLLMAAEDHHIETRWPWHQTFLLYWPLFLDSFQRLNSRRKELRSVGIFKSQISTVWSLLPNSYSLILHRSIPGIISTGWKNSLQAKQVTSVWK